MTRPYLAELRAALPGDVPLEEAHAIALQVAERLLPAAPAEDGP